MPVAVAAAALAACGAPQGSEPSTIVVADTVGGTVTSIVDGDTIEVATPDGRLTVRLVGTNAPDEGECFRDPARNHLVDTLHGSEVGLHVVGTDQFGRTLADVHVESTGRHVNLEMVSEGLAIATTPEEVHRRGVSLLEAEETAFETGSGLWASEACGEGSSPRSVAIEPRSSVIDPPGADRPEDETIVIRGGNQRLDLSGWMLRDESSRHRYVFPPGTILEAGAVLSIDSGASGWSPGEEPVWNNGGDVVLLLDPNGNVVDRWRY